jgi:hypothetical protein
MNRWKEKFDGHAIHGLLKTLRGALEREPAEVSDTEISERIRFSEVIDLLASSLAAARPETIPLENLDAISAHLANNVGPHIESYRATGDMPSLTAANDHLSGVLQQIKITISASLDSSRVPAPTFLAREIESVANSLLRSRASIEEKLNHLSETARSIQASLDELTRQLEVRRKDTESVLAQWQEQFSSAQESRNQSYAEWQRIASTEFSQNSKALIEKVAIELESDRKSYLEKLVALSAEAASNHEKIRTLHQLSARDSVTGGYQSNADDERQSARLWRRSSVVFIIVAAIWLFFSFTYFSGSITWESLLAKAPLTVVLLYGAAYSAQQSTRHRNQEIRNRRFALEMAAIDPYLQSLEPVDQQALKKELAKQFFGQNEMSEGASSFDEHLSGKALRSIGDVVPSIMDIIKKIKAGS